MKIHEIIAPSRELRWEIPRVSNDYVPVWVDVATLDASWKKDRGFYITPGGGGDVIRNRYPQFGEWLTTATEAVRMPEVGYDDHYKRVSFGNGRHRFAWLRDHGVTALPVCVRREDAQIFQRLFGTPERRSITSV